MNALSNARLPAENVVPPYARMIPGSSSLAFQYWGMSGRSLGSSQNQPKRIPGENKRANASPRALIRWLLPLSVADPFALYQPVVSDLVVVAGTCGALTLIWPAWGMPAILIPIYSVLVTLFSFSEGLYKSNYEPLPARLVALGRATLFAAVLTFIASDGDMLVRGVFGTTVATLGSLLHWRWLKHFLDRRFAYAAEKRNVLIVGGGPIGKSLARALRSQFSDQTVVCGFLDDELPLSPTVLGRIDDLEWVARAEFIDEVIFALPDQPQRIRMAAEIALRNHLDLRAVPDLPPGCWRDAATDRIGDVPVVTLHREPLPSATLFLKRVLDVVGAAVGLLLLSPIMALIAGLIRLDSPGPVFYAAERTGVKGCRFRCFKFRSMVVDSDDMKDHLRDQNQREGPIFKIENDPRITRVGGFLRRYSLDELPQLWNVLRGDMSMVGPRPHPIDDVNRYELHHYRRLDVKPGITGLWQITARRSPSFELNMHLDLLYIESWNLLLDLRILARTVRVLFAPEGA